MTQIHHKVFNTLLRQCQELQLERLYDKMRFRYNEVGSNHNLIVENNQVCDETPLQMQGVLRSSSQGCQHIETNQRQGVADKFYKGDRRGAERE